ncbi:glycosyltransferase [Natronorubrum bangense]|uniref:Group 1 glycosyl transferase n=2 Tax=Natronorubrum bangense TaxID=61858 RepID=L9WAJ9_9EURY|nr:glycosyltransferase [Natronorubrum bangense]ELY45343.1 group 1 glycosyl transferase [Natronorubrum bangense JCM 10635]QCC56812.1 glycosyltransferase family 1 protein [Natronorubrum bangense]
MSQPATESTATDEADTLEPAPADDEGRRTRATADRDQHQGTHTTVGSSPEEMRVLIITGLAHKNERHYGPLADVAGETTLVCLDPDTDIDGATAVPVPDVGPRIVRVVLLFFLALYEGYRNEYDAVASISLVPYGIYALILKALYGYPAHLGIIGIDLDHHAQQWYGAGPRWAFRRFDAVSVPGTDHTERLVGCGVAPTRIEILTNAIDIETYRPPTDDVEPDYEFVWVGRFSEEKDPVRFVRAVAELDATGREFRAAMVGDGALQDDVVEEINRLGVGDRIDLVGWVDDPLAYYHRATAFVLTSSRDALPLVMLEAMATGLAPVVPPVGSIPDVVVDGHNGLVVTDREPTMFAAAMARCLDAPDERDALAANATDVRCSFSLARAGEDWRRILTTLEA